MITRHAIICSLLLLASSVKAATITAYCACKKCCGPKATGIAANGKPPVQGVTVAGPRSIPLGSKISIKGIGQRIVTDRTAKVYDGRIDVYFERHADAVKFGIKQATVMYAGGTF